MSQDEIIDFLIKRRLTDGAVFYSRDEIQKNTGINRSHIYKQLNKLVEYGYIEKQKSLMGDYRYRILNNQLEKLTITIKGGKGGA